MTSDNPTSSTPRPLASRRGRPRLPAGSAALLMPLILSVMMTCVVSAIATARGIGLTPDFAGAFLKLWPAAWGLSWLVAFPTLLLTLPLVRRVVAALVEPPAAG